MMMFPFFTICPSSQNNTSFSFLVRICRHVTWRYVNRSALMYAMSTLALSIHFRNRHASFHVVHIVVRLVSELLVVPVPGVVLVVVVAN
jgi:hypothetical protein